MTQPFVHRRRVEFAETDMAGIAHYSRFLLWMEEAEHAMLRSLGLSVFQRTAAGDTVSWPRVSVACDYLAPAKFEDELAVTVTVERRGNKSLTYAFEFRRAADPTGPLLARGRTTAVCCRIGAGHKLESMPIPAEFAALRPGGDAGPGSGWSD